MTPWLRMLVTSSFVALLGSAIGIAPATPAELSSTRNGRVPPSTGAPFEAVKHLALAGTGHASLVADATGDGRDDMMVTTAFEGTHRNELILWPQTAEGTLGTPSRWRLHADQFAAGADLAAVDVTGDGLLDVAVTVEDGLAMFRGQAGSLVGPRYIGGVGRPFFVEDADFNGDGLGDLAVGSDNGLYVLRSTGSSFIKSTLSDLRQQEIEVADLSGDGRPDIVGCAFSCPGFDVWIQQGGGSFIKVSYELGDLITWRALAAGDVTADGLADVVLSDPSEGLEVWPQTPAGELGPPVEYLTGEGMSGPIVGDVDGDGRGDVIGDAPARLLITFQQADGTLGTLCPYEGLEDLATSTKGVSMGDLTGDGLPDVVVADALSLFVSVFVQLPMGTSSLTLTPSQTSIEIGESVTLSGALTIDNGGCPGQLPVSVERTDSTGTQVVGETTTDAFGFFSLSDVPAVAGQSLYVARWGGDALHTAGSSPEAAVDVAKLASTTTVSASSPVMLGTEVIGSGQVTSSDGNPVGVQTVHLARQNPDGTQTSLADVTTDAMGAFDFSDEPPALGAYRYDASWDGDATHDPSTGGADVTVTAMTASSDFNGDGYEDLAVGVPLESWNSVDSAGAVNVMFGSSDGLSSTGNQFWNQALLLNDPLEAGDEFGNTVAAGDFDGDGFADLAIGVPLEDVGSIRDAGAVQVLYGHPEGFRADDQQFWSQDSPGIEDAAEADDLFGLSFASGDFNNDGFGDLAINSVLEDYGFTDAGAVNVIYGSIDGLTEVGDQLWTQDSPGILDSVEFCDPTVEICDNFGSALSAGDYDGDGYGDLAVGASGEDRGAIDGGITQIIHGGPSGLSDAGDQLWSQDSTDINDNSEPGDFYGSRLATGDLNGDGISDLAIGVVGEDVGTNVDGGAINVMYGTPDGLAAPGDQYWNQNSTDILDSAEPCDLVAGEFCDYFGYAVAIGDFDGDGYGDLGIGVAGEDLSAVDVGVAQVIYGTASGLNASGNQLWNQDSPDINDNAEGGDAFGWEMTAGDFGKGPQDDLIAGVPWENVGNALEAGALNVIYGTTAGLAAAGDQYWNQNSTGIQDTAEEADFFAWGLAVSPSVGIGGTADVRYSPHEAPSAHSGVGTSRS